MGPTFSKNGDFWWFFDNNLVYIKASIFKLKYIIKQTIKSYQPKNCGKILNIFGVMNILKKEGKNTKNEKNSKNLFLLYTFCKKMFVLIQSLVFCLSLTIFLL